MGNPVILVDPNGHLSDAIMWLSVIGGVIVGSLGCAGWSEIRTRREMAEQEKFVARFNQQKAQPFIPEDPNSQAKGIYKGQRFGQQDANFQIKNIDQEQRFAEFSALYQSRAGNDLSRPAKLIRRRKMEKYNKALNRMAKTEGDSTVESKICFNKESAEIRRYTIDSRIGIGD